MRLVFIVLSMQCALTEANLSENSSSDYSSSTGCTPMLNLPIKFDVQQANQSQVLSELKFNIADLIMPLSNLGERTSFGAAMKLLSQFNIDESESESIDQNQEFNTIKFKNNELIVRGLNVSMFSVYLYTDSDPKCSLGILVKNTTLTGKFLYNGPLTLSDVSFVGYYKMQINDVYLTASTNFSKRIEENQIADSYDMTSNDSKIKQLNTTRPYYSLVANGLTMNISNLGYISIDIYDSPDFNAETTNNYILKILKRIMQRTIKRTYYMFESKIRHAMEIESRKSLDCQLSRFNSLLESNSTYQKDLARIVNNEIEKSNLTIVTLPNYEHQQTILATNAKVYFTNGSLSGLNKMKFNGETRLKLQDQHLLVNSSIGWTDLDSSFDWTIYVSDHQNPSAKGRVSVHIKVFDFDTVITKGVIMNSRIVVEQLIIKELDGVKLDISGLPGLNRVTRGAVNFFMRNFKQRIAYSIQPVIKQQLEKSLNKLEFFN